jgi:hypothetical protein
MHLLTAKNLAELHLSGNNQTAIISAQDFQPYLGFPALKVSSPVNQG